MKRVVILCNLLRCRYRASAQDATRPVYLDPSKPTQQRVADLIGRMTLEEKAQQLNHLNVGIPRLQVAAWGGWNQTLHGVWSKQPTTLFPAAIAMGATWDPALVQTITGAMCRTKPALSITLARMALVRSTASSFAHR
jgi:beta-glucosidase